MKVRNITKTSSSIGHVTTKRNEILTWPPNEKFPNLKKKKSAHCPAKKTYTLSTGVTREGKYKIQYVHVYTEVQNSCPSQYQRRAEGRRQDETILALHYKHTDPVSMVSVRPLTGTLLGRPNSAAAGV